jgi:hypothetical protein
MRVHISQEWLQGLGFWFWFWDLGPCRQRIEWINSFSASTNPIDPLRDPGFYVVPQSN